MLVKGNFTGTMWLRMVNTKSQTRAETTERSVEEAGSDFKDDKISALQILLRQHCWILHLSDILCRLSIHQKNLSFRSNRGITESHYMIETTGWSSCRGGRRHEMGYLKWGKKSKEASDIRNVSANGISFRLELTREFTIRLAGVLKPKEGDSGNGIIISVQSVSNEELAGKPVSVISIILLQFKIRYWILGENLLAVIWDIKLFDESKTTSPDMLAENDSWVKLAFNLWISCRVCSAGPNASSGLYFTILYWMKPILVHEGRHMINPMKSSPRYVSTVEEVFFQCSLICYCSQYWICARCLKRG